MNQTPSFLDVKRLEYRVGARTILPTISFRVEQGAFACLLGPSGCGKTTALRLIAGLEKPGAGEIYLDEACLSSAATHRTPDARGITMVFQQPTLFVHLTAAQNVAFGIRHLAANERRERVMHLLEHVGLNARADAYPHELSGGQQHRVALARALAPSPKLLLLDEPFAHLDPERRVRLRNETRALTRHEGVTCLMVTHDASEAMQMSDTMILMDAHGRVRQQGTPHDVYHRPADRYAALALGEMNLIPATSDGRTLTSPVGSWPTDSTKTGELLVGVRPQDVRVSDEEGSISGQIEQVLCTGPEDFLNVRLSDGLSLQARLAHRHHWRVGDAVRLEINTADLHLFDRS